MDQRISRKPYSPEFRERAVRLFVEHRPEYPSEVAALRALASRLGCSPDSLRLWAHQARRDVGEGPGPTSAESEADQKAIRWIVFPPNADQGVGARDP
jgi:transposase-like protein